MTPPILLHGFSASSRAWGRTVLDGLTSVAGRPVLFDVPGHGSRATELDPAAYTLGAVHDAIDRLIGREPARLIGYSMGGRLALSYAAERPERIARLVLESASPGLPTEKERAARRTADEALAVAIETRGVEWFAEYWDSLPLFESRAELPGAFREELRAIRLANRSPGLAMALRGLGTGALPSYWRALPEITTPTLLIAGELDRKFVGIAREMAGRMPQSRLHMERGAGHTVHLERPAAWVETVAAFLAE